MDKNIEELFVKKFIVKGRKERIFFELSSEKKRRDRVYRLYNDLDGSCSIFSGQLSEETLPDKIKKSVAKMKSCYVIADGADDGAVLPFELAFKNLEQSAGLYIIFCAPDIVIAKDEVFYGAPEQCILYKN